MRCKALRGPGRKPWSGLGGKDPRALYKIGVRSIVYQGLYGVNSGMQIITTALMFNNGRIKGIKMIFFSPRNEILVQPR